VVQHDLLCVLLFSGWFLPFGLQVLLVLSVFHSQLRGLHLFRTGRSIQATSTCFAALLVWALTAFNQMMVSLVRDSQTAQGFGGLLIAMTSLFSGLLIRPNNITGFWTFGEFPYCFSCLASFGAPSSNSNVV
jgi:hypothetical protein